MKTYSLEKIGGMRERLFKEWVALEKPSKQEQRAYWAGYYRGFATATHAKK